MSHNKSLPTRSYKARLTASMCFGILAVPALCIILIYELYSLAQSNWHKMDSVQISLYTLFSAPIVILCALLMYWVVIKFIDQLKGQNGLLIDGDGLLNMGNSYRFHCRWDEVTRFEAGYVWIGWPFKIKGAVYYFKEKTGINALDKKIIPAKSYGLKAEELTDILNEYWDNFHSSDDARC